MRAHYETFAAEVEGLPQLVTDEFDAYLDCGILAEDFLRLTCNTCARDTQVAFSCKRRGLKSQVMAVPPQQTTTREGDCRHEHSKAQRMRRAPLLKRAYDIELERCACGGQLKLIAVIEEPAVIEKILKHIGLDPQPPLREKARRVELFQAA